MCPGCKNVHEEHGKAFVVMFGDEDWHAKCWDKEVKAYGTEG